MLLIHALAASFCGRALPVIDCYAPSFLLQGHGREAASMSETSEPDPATLAPPSEPEHECKPSGQ